MKPKRGPHFEKRRLRREQAFRRAKWLSEMLLRSMGYVCAKCGEVEPTLLQVDHMDGITWDRRALRYDARVERYVREWAEGEARLRCLCIHCNSARNQLKREPGEDDLSPGWRYDHSDTSHLPEAPF